jgi:hypothetical protein
MPRSWPADRPRSPHPGRRSARSWPPWKPRPLRRGLAQGLSGQTRPRAHLLLRPSQPDPVPPRPGPGLLRVLLLRLGRRRASLLRHRAHLRQPLRPQSRPRLRSDRRRRRRRPDRDPLRTRPGRTRQHAGRSTTGLRRHRRHIRPLRAIRWLKAVRLCRAMRRLKAVRLCRAMRRLKAIPLRPASRWLKTVRLRRHRRGRPGR